MTVPPVRYRTARDGTIDWVDPAFEDFARENGAPGLGRSVLGTPIVQHLAGPEVRALYGLLMDRVRASRRGVEFPFRCDAPDLRRFMRMRVDPDDGGGLMFTSHQERTEPRQPPVPGALLAGPEREAVADEFIYLCAWCKRIETQAGGWVEVEDALAQGLLDRDVTGPISHAACPECTERMLALL